MDCPNCHEPVETGAAFCGNCGQALTAPAPAVTPPTVVSSAPNQPPPSPIAQVIQNQPPALPAAPPPNGPLVAAAVTGHPAAAVPSYALATPRQHAGETKALLALLFGLAGIVGALFMAALGLVLGVTGIIMGTMSRSSTKRRLSTAGLIFSSLAVLAGLAVWTYAIKRDSKLAQAAPSTPSHNLTATPVSASSLSTPCYSTGFVDKLNVSNAANSCDMSAFNGPTLEKSTNAYKVYADTSQAADAQNFTSIVKPALEKDVHDNLPGFTIDSERAAQFAGSPAYIVSTSNTSQHVAVTEAAVLHQVGAGDNVFILVHAVNGSTADLSTLEAQWQWK